MKGLIYTSKPKAKTNNENLHANHRARLRQRFAETGLKGFADHNILELLLFYSIPRRDTNEIAHRLINTFGSLAEVFDAPFSAIASVEGVGENTATLIKLIPKIFAEYERSHADEKAVVSNSENAVKYLKSFFADMSIEYIVIVLLDNAGRVINTFQQDGYTKDSVVLSSPEVLSRIISISPAAVVLAHCHPRGLAAPSKDDVKVTEAFSEMLAKLKIKLCDHIIFSPTDVFCMSQMKSMKIHGTLSF